MGLPIGLINNYYSITIRQNLISGETSLNNVIDKIDQQIKVTDFITTKSKNTFTDNIYENLYKVEEYINFDKDIENFSKVVKKLIDRDPNLYNALVWDAKLMSYKELEKKKILDRINSAIELSPASQEAYRFILDYTKKNDDEKLFNLYCEKYHTSLLGGKRIKERSLFDGSSLTRFGIQINNQFNEIIINEGINLNRDEEYVFILKKPTDIKNLQILSNFLPGTSINIKSFELLNSEDRKFTIYPKDIYLSSKNSFFIEEQNSLKILVANYHDEKIKIKFSKFYEKILQIKIKINFSKANLTNQGKC